MPGRHPLARADLVVVGTSLDGPGAPALLEAARVLVERSQWATVPERTVLVALWTGRWADRRGVAETLAAPVWSRGAVRAVLVVGDGPAGGVDTLAVETLAPGGGGPGLAAALVERVAALAARPPRPAPPDTVAVR